MPADELTALQSRLAAQIAIVRAQFQETVACYSVKVQGQLTDVGETLTSADGADLTKSERVARVATLKRALAEVEKLDLRPTKGRRRDLRAVQNVATYLGEVVAEW